MSLRGDDSVWLQAQSMYHELVVDWTAAYRGAFAIAVVQMGALVLVVAPFTARSTSEIVAGFALFALAFSFLSDIIWLARRSAQPGSTVSG